MTNTRLYKASAVAAVALFAAAWLPAQSADDATAGLQDAFESALFGDGGTSGGTASAQNDGGNSAFDALAATGEKRLTEYLVGGTVAVSSTTLISRKYESATSLADATGTFLGKVTVPDSGALFASFSASYPFFQGYGGTAAPPPAAKDDAPKFALSELHYSFDIGKVAFFRLGKQLVAWGPSVVWTPVDFVNADKKDSFASLDSRAGKNGLRVHVPLGRANAFAFADFSPLTKSETYGYPAEAVNLAGRVDFTAADFEFGFTAYGGKNSQAKFGADFSGRAIGTTLYGEASIAPGSDASSSGYLVSAGFSRPLDELKRWTVSGEAFYNSRGKDLSGLTAKEFAALPAEERIPLYQGNLYGYASVSADKIPVDGLSSTLSGMLNAQDRSGWIKFSETVAVARAVPITVSVSWYGGGDDREFTRTAGDGAVSAAVSTRISF